MIVLLKLINLPVNEDLHLDIGLTLAVSNKIHCFSCRVAHVRQEEHREKRKNFNRKQ